MYNNKRVEGRLLHEFSARWPFLLPQLLESVAAEGVLLGYLSDFMYRKSGWLVLYSEFGVDATRLLRAGHQSITGRVILADLSEY